MAEQFYFLTEYMQNRRRLPPISQTDDPMSEWNQKAPAWWILNKLCNDLGRDKTRAIITGIWGLVSRYRDTLHQGYGVTVDERDGLLLMMILEYFPFYVFDAYDPARGFDRLVADRIIAIIDHYAFMKGTMRRWRLLNEGYQAINFVNDNHPAEEIEGAEL